MKETDLMDLLDCRLDIEEWVRIYGIYNYFNHDIDAWCVERQPPLEGVNKKFTYFPYPGCAKLKQTPLTKQEFERLFKQWGVI